MNKSKLLFLGLLFIAIVIISVSFGYMLAEKMPVETAETIVAAAENQPAAQPSLTPEDDEIPFLSQILPKESNSGKSWFSKYYKTIVRLLWAVFLSAILAFRPRKNVPLFQPNLYVAQTQILLAVVAAALMMIVGDNTARAFAIFAAVSLVRFRTNIRDPKDITVLLISLALGLAAGVGRWELGLTLCIFVLALLWILEYRESDSKYRSMELTVKTRNTDQTQNVLKEIFSSYNLEGEVRQLNPSDSETVGCLMYYLNLRLNISTDNISDKIIATDVGNIEGIQWKQQKSVTYIQ